MKNTEEKIIDSFDTLARNLAVSLFVKKNLDIDNLLKKALSMSKSLEKMETPYLWEEKPVHYLCRYDRTFYILHENRIKTASVDMQELKISRIKYIRGIFNNLDRYTKFEIALGLLDTLTCNVENIKRLNIETYDLEEYKNTLQCFEYSFRASETRTPKAYKKAFGDE